MAGFTICEEWWCHSPDRVSENEHVKLLWDFKPIADHHLIHNRPDMMLIMKNEKKVFLIDVAIPGDSRLFHKFAEKQNKYVDLKIELWHFKVYIVPIIIGAIGSIPKTYLY